MLVLPISFTNPTLQTLTLEEYFNPCINKLYVSGRKSLNGAEVLFWYKALWTRDNIINNIDTFFSPEHYSHYIDHDDFRHILGKIDDEDLWKLAFLAIQTPREGNRLTFIANPIYTIDWSTSARRQDCHFNRSTWSMQYSYRGDNFRAEMKAKLDELADQFHNTVSSYPSFQLNIDGYVHGNATLVAMSKYTQNKKVYRSSEQTAETLCFFLTENPTASIRLSTATGQNCFVYLSNPVSRTNKRALWNTLSYSADVLELLPHPLVLKGEVKPICYGVELEVSTKYTTKELIEACDEPFMAGKQDSSISGSMRFKVELVTTPMSLKSHKKEWSHFFSNLDYDNFDTTINTNNGMHVHIGRDNFDNNHLRTFAWFFGNPCNRDFIIALSERKPGTMHQYSAMPAFPPAFSKTASLTSVVAYFDMLRGAVNIHKSKPTIEVRIFKGIASYATILKNLEAVDAIYHFTQQCSQTQAGLKDFLSFIEKTPRNKYAALKEFLSTLDTKKLLSAAQLNDLVFNVTDPRQIVSLIQKKNFPITSHHVTILNQKQGTRTFIFNKATGSIEITRMKHGKISHLDRLLEKKYTRRPGWTNITEIAQAPPEPEALIYF